MISITFAWHAVRAAARFVVLTAVAVSVSGCFLWDTTIVHRDGTSKPYVGNRMVADAAAVRAGYFDPLLRELQSKNITVDLRYTTQRSGDKATETALMAWAYEGFLWSEPQCTKASKPECTVRFRQWVDPQKFGEFEYVPPAFTLTVYLPAQSYLGSDAAGVSDSKGYKVLRWRFENIRPRQTVAFWYRFRSG